MTETEINQAISAALGHSPRLEHSFEGRDENRYFECEHCGITQRWSDFKAKGKHPSGQCRNDKTDYYRDLNACAEMENWLSLVQERVYAQALRKVLGFHNHTYFDWIHATAPQRCEAFLKTIGKWKE